MINLILKTNGKCDEVNARSRCTAVADDDKLQATLRQRGRERVLRYYRYSIHTPIPGDSFAQGETHKLKFNMQQHIPGHLVALCILQRNNSSVGTVHTHTFLLAVT